MIYTITFNPSLDYIVRLDALTLGRVNRTCNEALYPGGKGINVSIVLSNLGLESKALGFVSGFTGGKIEQLLNEFGCHTDFIALPEGFSRINVKIQAQQETEINGQGPKIPPQAIDVLFEKLKMLQKGDVLVLAGSIPNTLPADIYERILASVSGRDILCVVDATGELLLHVLNYKPFLIKPNNHELGELFGTELHGTSEIAAHAKKLQARGAQNVLVSLAGDGAILVCENGEIYESRPPEGTVLNSVGAGDSMVAGFLAGYLNTGAYYKAFLLGLAAGSASAYSPWLAGRDAICAFLENPRDYRL